MADVKPDEKVTRYIEIQTTRYLFSASHSIVRTFQSRMNKSCPSNRRQANAITARSMQTESHPDDIVDRRKFGIKDHHLISALTKQVKTATVQGREERERD